MFPMIRGRSGNHRGIADTGLGELLERRKHRRLASKFRRAAARRLHIVIYQSGELAVPGLLREFMNMTSVDSTHATDSGHSNFKNFRHDLRLQCTTQEVQDADSRPS